MTGLNCVTGWPALIVVTGTDTGVGKTVVTAALAAALTATGARVAAYKPAQTGIRHDGFDDEGNPADMPIVAELAGVPTHEGCRLVEPMAPRQAAAVEGARLPTLADHVAAVEGLAARHDHVLIEGAGGLLVELTDAGETVADLAAALLPPADTPPADQRVGVVVVARSALGTLNHTSLTLDWLAARRFPVLGIVLGSVGEHPSRLEALNHEHLNTLGPGVIGQVPHGAPTMTAQAFAAAAPGWFTTTA